MVQALTNAHADIYRTYSHWLGVAKKEFGYTPVTSSDFVRASRYCARISLRNIGFANRVKGAQWVLEDNAREFYASCTVGQWLKRKESQCGRWIMQVSGHAFCIADGIILDSGPYVTAGQQLIQASLVKE